MTMELDRLMTITELSEMPRDRSLEWSVCLSHRYASSLL
jgi:hypothetical protein